MDTTGAKFLAPDELNKAVRMQTTPEENARERKLAEQLEQLRAEQPPGIEPEPWEPASEDGGLQALAYNLSRLADRVKNLEEREGIIPPAPPEPPEVNSFGIKRPQQLRSDVEHGLNDSLDYSENAEFSKKHWEHRAIEAEKLLGKAQGEAAHHKRNVERLTAVAQAFISEAGGETVTEAELYNTDSGSVRHALNAIKQMRINHDRLAARLQAIRKAVDEESSKRVGDPREEV